MTNETCRLLWRKYLLNGLEGFDRNELLDLFVYIRDELIENDEAGIEEDLILTTAFRKVCKALGIQSKFIRPTNREDLGTS
jgi:hypothetical protein